MNTDLFEHLTTDQLTRMNERAWREAALCWNQYRAEVAAGGNRLMPHVEMLYRGALSADKFWTETRAALLARNEATV